MSAASLVDVITRRLLDVESHQIPELKQTTFTEALNDIASGIREDLAHVDRDYEELQMMVEEGEASVADGQRVHIRLASLRAAFREALLQTKRRIDAQTAAGRRADLFRGSKAAASGAAQTSSSADDDPLMTATSDVTDGLRRTMQLMQQELDRSVLSNQMLDDSSSSLQMTGEQYSTFTNILNTSKNLIVSMERADVIDRLLIGAALIFFGLVCLYILKRRVLDKGIRVAALFGKLVPTRMLSRRHAEVVQEAVVAATETWSTATTSPSATALALTAATAAASSLSTAIAASSTSLSSFTLQPMSVSPHSISVPATATTNSSSSATAQAISTAESVSDEDVDDDEEALPARVRDEPAEPVPPAEPSLEDTPSAATAIEELDSGSQQPVGASTPEPEPFAVPTMKRQIATESELESLRQEEEDHYNDASGDDQPIAQAAETEKVLEQVAANHPVVDDLEEGAVIPPEQLKQISKKLVNKGYLEAGEEEQHQETAGLQSDEAQETTAARMHDEL